MLRQLKFLVADRLALQILTDFRIRDHFCVIYKQYKRIDQTNLQLLLENTPLAERSKNVQKKKKANIQYTMIKNIKIQQ